MKRTRSVNQFIFLIFTMSTSAFLAPNLQASPMFCQQGTPFAISTGFNSVGGNHGNLACVSRSGACVDSNLCPQTEPMNCPAGSEPVRLTVGFKSIGNKLSCPVFIEKCVNNHLCAQPGPIPCAQGRAVYLNTGFFDVKGHPGLSCLKQEARCVDDKLCPMP